MSQNTIFRFIYRIIAILFGVVLLVFLGYLTFNLIISLSDDTSTIVNIILSILSFVLAAISVVTVVITLKQNNKMLEANSKPYVVAYLVYQEAPSHVYLCIRNFGQTSAIVESLNIEPSFSLYRKNCNEIINKTMFAPNQQVHFLVSDKDKKKMIHDDAFDFLVNIKYRDCCTKKVYNETYKMNMEYVMTVMSSESNISGLSPEQNALHNIERILAYTKNNNM